MGLIRKPPIIGVAHSTTTAELDRRTIIPDGWQHEAWQIWRACGEIHYPTSQVARLVSRVKWTADPDTFDVAEAFLPDDIAELSRLLALHLLVPGEGWLIKSGVDDQLRAYPDGLEHWQVLSTTVSKFKERIERAAVKVRVYSPDPADPSRADSSVRSALGPARELLTLEALSRSQSRSRIATAGILLRPAGAHQLVDEDEQPVDFNDLLVEAMTEPIINEDSAAAVVPLDIEWDPETIEKWRHLVLERPYDENLQDRMERVIRRIALALDIWPELLLGVTDINHWSTWFLAEDTWRGHAAPLADQIAEGFMVAIAEDTRVDVSIKPDPAEILSRRSTVQDALNAVEIGAVGLKFVREAIGATEEDAPTEEDLEIVAALTGRRLPGDEPEPQEEGPPATDEEANREAVEPGDGEPVAASLVAAAPARDPSRGLGVELARIDDQLRGWLAGAADSQIVYARGRLGMQVRHKLRGEPLMAELDGVENGDVIAVLGMAEAAERIDVEATARTAIEPIADRWLARLNAAADSIEALADVDLSGVEHKENRVNSAEVLIDDLTAWVLATAETPTNALGVGPDLRRVLRVAGGR